MRLCVSRVYVICASASTCVVACMCVCVRLCAFASVFALAFACVFVCICIFAPVFVFVCALGVVHLHVYLYARLHASYICVSNCIELFSHLHSVLSYCAS